jgi:alkylhydroperoxidase family enzyme
VSRIAPVPPEDIDPELWQRVVTGAEAGYATVEYAGILAYHRELFAAHVERLGMRRPAPLLGPRLSELVRLRSAQLGGCQQCQAARYEPELVPEDDVACLPVGAGGGLTPREEAALEFVRLMHVDHFSVGDRVYSTLHEHFSVAEIVELGTLVAGLLGTHRLMSTLALLDASPPAIAYDPAEVWDGVTPADEGGSLASTRLRG